MNNYIYKALRPLASLSGARCGVSLARRFSNKKRYIINGKRDGEEIGLLKDSKAWGVSTLASLLPTVTMLYSSTPLLSLSGGLLSFGASCLLGGLAESFYKKDPAQPSGNTKENMDPKVVKKMQHLWRKKQRDREFKALYKKSMNWDEKHQALASQGEPDDVLKDANTPYRPTKCSRELATKLLNAAHEISSKNKFLEIRHFTNKDNIPSILDQGMYAPDILKKFEKMKKSKTHSIGVYDHVTGDDKAICFAPNQVTEGTVSRSNAVEFILDFEAIQQAKDNPGLYFKQMDFGFKDEEIRSLTVGGESFHFSHTKKCEWKKEAKEQKEIYEGIYNEEYTQSLQFYTGANGDDTVTQYAIIPKIKMMSTNTDQMYEILTMNFFRYLDNIRDSNGKIDDTFIKSFYEKLENLDDKGLQDFLLSLRGEMTCATEIDFYCAFDMRPEYIKDIKIYNQEGLCCTMID